MKKRNLFIICVAVLLVTAATGCSSDNNDDNIVQETAVPEDVGTFFNNCFEEGTSTVSTLGGFFSPDDYRDVLDGDGTILPSLVKVRAIHSQEELEASYKGELALPKIDFSQYVLLLGLTYRSSGRISLGKVRLLHLSDNSYELQVIMYSNTNKDLAYKLDIAPVMFWKLYPKFPTSNMKVVLRTEEVWLNK